MELNGEVLLREGASYKVLGLAPNRFVRSVGLFTMVLCVLLGEMSHQLIGPYSVCELTYAVQKKEKKMTTPLSQTVGSLSTYTSVLFLLIKHLDSFVPLSDLNHCAGGTFLFLAGYPNFRGR